MRMTIKYNKETGMYKVHSNNSPSLSGMKRPFMNKKKLILLLLVALSLFVAASVNAQTKTNIPVGTPNQVQKPAAVAPDSVLQMPTGCNLPSAQFIARYLQPNRKGFFYHDTCSGKVYYYNLTANQWRMLTDSNYIGVLLSSYATLQALSDTAGNIRQAIIDSSNGATLDRVLTNGNTSNRLAQVGRLNIVNATMPKLIIGKDTVPGGFNLQVTVDPTTGNPIFYPGGGLVSFNSAVNVDFNLGVRNTFVNRAIVSFPGGSVNEVPLNIGVSSTPPSFTQTNGNIYNDGDHLWMYLSGGWKQLDNDTTGTVDNADSLGHIAAGDYVTRTTTQTITAQNKTFAPVLDLSNNATAVNITPSGTFLVDNKTAIGLRVNTGGISFGAQTGVSNIALQVDGGSTVVNSANSYFSGKIRADTILYNTDTCHCNPSGAVIIGDSASNAAFTVYNADGNSVIGPNPTRTGYKLTVNGTSQFNNTITYPNAALGSPLIYGLYLDPGASFVKGLAVKKTIWLYVPAGQSNAYGQSYASPDSMPVPKPGIGWVYQQAGDTVVPLTQNTIYAMWPQFAVTLNQITGRTICFVQTAVSGSAQAWQADDGVSGNWDTSGALYARSIRLIDSAIAKLTAMGYDVQLGGILWDQGEQDALKIGQGVITAQTYYNALAAMVQRYHNYYGTPYLPFYIWRIGVRIGINDNTTQAVVRQQQQNYAQTDSLCKIVFWNAVNYPNMPGYLNGDVHYSAIGYKQAGLEGATEVAKGVSKWEQNNYTIPILDTPGQRIYSAFGPTPYQYTTLKRISGGQLYIYDSSLSSPGLILSPQTGALLGRNVSGTNVSTGWTQETWSATLSDASIHRLRRASASGGQISTGNSIGTISFEAQNPTGTYVQGAAITVVAGSNTNANGTPPAGITMSNNRYTGAIGNFLVVDAVGKVSIATGSARGGTPTTAGAVYQALGGTYTDTVTATGTTAILRMSSIASETYAASNTGVVVTDYPNLSVNPVTAGTNVTISHPITIESRNGTMLFAGATTAYPSLSIPAGNLPTSGQRTGDISVNGTNLIFWNGANRTVANLDESQTLTNKTIAAGSNTITGLTNTNLSGSAAITNANLATMAANTVKGSVAGGTPSDLTVEQLSVPKVVATGNLTGQTTAGNVVTYTTGAADSSFEVSGYVTVTAVSLDVIQLQVTYTGEDNVSRTAVFFPMGATSAGLSATGKSNYAVMGQLRVKASTTITVATSLTTSTGSITFNAGAKIIKTP